MSEAARHRVEHNLGDVYDFRSGLSKEASAFGSGHPFLTFKDVFYNFFVPDELGDLVNSTVADRDAFDVRRGDVFLTRTSETMEDLGMSCVALRDVPFATFNGFTKRLRPKPDAQIVPEFAGYFFRSPQFRREVTAMSSMSTRASLNNEMLSRLRITLPNLRTQAAIGATLKALDDKVKQNLRTAQALERLARAIFRAWFVDFEPVKAKAAGATAFASMPQSVFDALPIRFVDSGIGPVPEGWEVKAAVDVAIVAIGKTPPRKEPQWFTTDPSQIPWASIRDMGTCGVFIGNTSEYLTREAVERFRVRRIPDRSVLFSFKLTLGRVAIADGEITSNEAIAHFISESPDSIGAEYLYCYLVEFDHNQLGSTSSIATATNSGAVKTMPVLVPTSSTDAFTELVRPMFDALRSLTRESNKLAAMRDYLLPKLLSGQIDVEDTHHG